MRVGQVWAIDGLGGFVEQLRLGDLGHPIFWRWLGDGERCVGLVSWRCVGIP